MLLLLTGIATPILAAIPELFPLPSKIATISNSSSVNSLTFNKSLERRCLLLKSLQDFLLP